MSVQLNTVQLR